MTVRPARAMTWVPLAIALCLAAPYQAQGSLITAFNDGMTEARTEVTMCAVTYLIPSGARISTRVIVKANERRPNKVWVASPLDCRNSDLYTEDFKNFVKTAIVQNADFKGAHAYWDERFTFQAP